MSNDAVRYTVPGNLLLRVAAVSSIALIICMAFLFLITRTYSEIDRENRTITVSVAFDHSHIPMASDDSSHMDMASMTHYDEGVWAEKEFTAPEDMWLTEFSTDFTGESVHNFYLFIKDTHDSWCPENPTAIYSGGTVSSKRPITFDPPYGIFIQKGTTLVLTALYHDAAGESAVRPTFSVHARYEPAGSTTRSVPISLHFITPGPCTYTRPVFPVPARSKEVVYSSDQKPFVFSDDGTIIRAMAHFHAAYKKGVANTVRLFLNGTTIDSFTTTDVGDGEERNPRLLKDKLVKVHGGDILTMHAIFSNPSAAPVAEGMAIIGFYFAPETRLKTH